MTSSVIWMQQIGSGFSIQDYVCGGNWERCLLNCSNKENCDHILQQFWFWKVEWRNQIEKLEKNSINLIQSLDN